jgi:hypothetical protein
MSHPSFRQPSSSKWTQNKCSSSLFLWPASMHSK